MSEVRIIVDHMKFDYKGIFDSYEFFRQIDAWFLFRGYEKKEDKNTEQVFPTGKVIEWEVTHWKKASFHTKNIVKIRVLMWDLKKVEVFRDDKKIKIDQGRVLAVFDGFLELDFEHYWEERPVFVFLRTLYDKFIYKSYTERFEQRLTQDVFHVYHHMMNFMNMHQKYKVVSKVPHFAIH